MAGRPLSRSEALAWRERWSDEDRAALAAEWDRLGVVAYYAVASGGYIGCTDARGTRVMFVAPGYVWFRGGCEPEGRALPPWNGYLLSTFRDPGSHQPSVARTERFCPEHGMALPYSGICDVCDE